MLASQLNIHHWSIMSLANRNPWAQTRAFWISEQPRRCYQYCWECSKQTTDSPLILMSKSKFVLSLIFSLIIWSYCSTSRSLGLIQKSGAAAKTPVFPFIWMRLVGLDYPALMPVSGCCKSTIPSCFLLFMFVCLVEIERRWWSRDLDNE